MALSFTARKRVRKNFGRLPSTTTMPNLIEVQKSSYDAFLQMDVPANERPDTGLQGVFKSVFPISDFSDTASLEFVAYELEPPKYDTDECEQRGMTYAGLSARSMRISGSSAGAATAASASTGAS